jgi:hypothetical protein
MTGVEVLTAKLKSLNTINLRSPYQGKNHGAIHVTTGGDVDPMVVVSVDKGQILCSQNCSIAVRFDTSPKMIFKASAAADMSSDYVVIENGPLFFSWLKASKNILVQLELYQNGAQILEFQQEKPPQVE